MGAIIMDDRITVTINDEERTFLMSYGLLNRLAKMVGEYEEPSAMFVDPEMQEKILLYVIKGRKADFENDSIEDFEISIQDSQNLVKWAGQHVIDFFVKGLTSANEVSQQFEDQMTSLAPSQTGSQS
jgi:hypothetical protein